MSGNNPSRPRQNLPEHLDLREVVKPLYEVRSPEDRYRGPFFTGFTSRHARRIRAKLTTTQHAVLDAILALWSHGKRDIETSITQLKTELEAVSADIGAQHISTAISALQKANVVRRMASGHNRLVLRVNPHLYWKGRPNGHNRVIADERELWSAVGADGPFHSDTVGHSR